MTDSMKPSVLIVDYDPNMAKTIGAAARIMDFEVRTTSNVEIFMDQYGNDKPSFIGMDIVMADMDGIEIVDWLAKQNCAVPVILVNGHGGKYLTITRQISSSQKVSIAGTLGKPFRIGELDALLLQFLNAGEG